MKLLDNFSVLALAFTAILMGLNMNEAKEKITILQTEVTALKAEVKELNQIVGNKGSK